MGATKNGKIEPSNISLYLVVGQYFVGYYAMLIFSRRKEVCHARFLKYIKADDHYLNIFTSNGKNHYLRGNFAKLRKSYPQILYNATDPT